MKGSYERMMELAGHIRPSTASTTRRSSRLATIESEQLTPEEEDELLKFLAFIRMRGEKMKWTLLKLNTTSGYLHACPIEFAAGLNCIIGARWTCKSAIVDMIAHGH